MGRIAYAFSALGKRRQQKITENDIKFFFKNSKERKELCLQGENDILKCNYFG